MAEKLFCVDFGSAYTKVSLRRARRTNSEMLLHPQQSTDEFRICLPSAALVDTSNPTARYEFGVATEGRASGGTINVRRNWKRDLFFPPPAGAPATPARATRPMTRLESLLHSVAFRQLAEQHRVTPAELHSLRRMVIHATSLTLPIHMPPERPARAPDDPQLLAEQYFTWLRRVVLNACSSLQPTPSETEKYPVRITVPAFTAEEQLAQHPGCISIATALRHAGWQLHPTRPFISEPYANAIGALTQGSNCTRVADMFNNGMIITSLRDRRNYRVTVIDVGAFTTDFATLTLRTEGRTITMQEIRFDSRTHSVSLGMSDLDEAILSSLTERNQHYMRNEAPATDWAELRHEVYLRQRPFYSPIGEIGGAAERPGIDRAFEVFHARLATATEEFFHDQDDFRFKEIVLSGGGCTLPTIQESLICAAERGRAHYHIVHLPIAPLGVRQRETTNQQVVMPLGNILPRGATALGGTSAYFDMVP